MRQKILYLFRKLFSRRRIVMDPTGVQARRKFLKGCRKKALIQMVMNYDVAISKVCRAKGITPQELSKIVKE